MTRFRQVPVEVDFPALERSVLSRWTEDRTFQRSVEARRGCQPYVFYDGPPFATGLPHYGHILTSYIKDVVPRYFTMQGRYVPRRWGWDCHGLPVEYEVEKELGIRSRRDILEYGIDRFNNACRGTVLRYADQWQQIVGRLGRWVDFDDQYRTMDPEYIESVVSVFEQLYKKGLVYEGSKVVPYCWRCQTGLSNFEARQDDAFRARQDPAITVKFKRKQDPTQRLLAWTTTPWTLPANAALAVNAEATYGRLEGNGESVWLAVEAIPRFQREFGTWPEIERKLGRELVGSEYEPLFPYFAEGASFRVVAADFVDIGDGTGVVHIAPAFGEDDAAVCAKEGIAGANPVRDDGTFDERVTEFMGIHVFDANEQIVRSLQSRGSIARWDTIEHNYPHCWRCDSPLIYRAIRSWFVEVTKVKEQLLAANRQVRWIPEHIQSGRFGKWLENARDWAISRSRFWGAPIPVWRCDGCATVEVVGSKSEIESRAGRALTDWHRPAIDEYTWACASCGQTMRRVSDVLDCWFESGAMPYAQVHYPFENKDEFRQSFPGDFIVEYVAQTRGWFYTMVVLAASMFDSPPFRNAVCHGVILAEDGRKMSKRLKNYPDPLEIVETYGSDALRIALLRSAVTRGTDIRFSPDSVRDSVRRFCIPVWNTLHLFTAYASLDAFEPRGSFGALTRLDRYLLSETERLRTTLEKRMDVYDFAGCYDAIEDYVVLLSSWYVRRSKQRLWGNDSADKAAAYEVLYAALKNFALLTAPFMPFLADSMYEVLTGGSVHMEDWPKPRPEWSDDSIVAEMNAVRTAVRLTRMLREERRIRHRQPLRSVRIAGLSPESMAANRELLLDELNVKSLSTLASPEEVVVPQVKIDYARLGRKLRAQVKIVAAAITEGKYELFDNATRLRAAGVELESEDFSFRYVPRSDSSGSVAAEGGVIILLDTTIDPALTAEGWARDLNRAIQDLRKDAGLRYDERVVVSLVVANEVRDQLAPHLDWLREQTLAVAIQDEPFNSPPNAQCEIAFEDQTATISLQTVR